MYLHPLAQLPLTQENVRSNPFGNGCIHYNSSSHDYCARYSEFERSVTEIERKRNNETGWERDSEREREREREREKGREREKERRQGERVCEIECERERVWERSLKGSQIWLERHIPLKLILIAFIIFYFPNIRLKFRGKGYVDVYLLPSNNIFCADLNGTNISLNPQLIDKISLKRSTLWIAKSTEWNLSNPQQHFWQTKALPLCRRVICFFLIWPSPASFCLISSFSHHTDKCCATDYEWKKHRSCVWDSNLGPQAAHPTSDLFAQMKPSLKISKKSKLSQVKVKRFY